MFSSRHIYNTSLDSLSYAKEITVSKHTAFAWFHTQKPFRPVISAESYADVLRKQACRIVKQAQNYIKKCYIPRKKFFAEPESVLHTHKQFHKKYHTPRVCMHVDKQYPDQITLENRFQALQNLETVEESRQSCTESQTQGNIEVAFAGNAKQEQVSKVAANTLNKTDSTKESFHSAKNNTDGAAIMANQKQSLAGNKNKIGSFDGEGNIRSMQHDQEHINNMDLGTACDAKFYHCHKETQDLNNPISLAQDIPDHIFYDRYNSADFRACIKQNGDAFSVVPLTAMQSYTGKPVHWETIPDIYSSHTMIRQSGLPNFLGHRIPITSQLKPHRWRFHLRDFWDKQLPDLIEFGFPLDFDRKNVLESTETNHASVLIILSTFIVILQKKFHIMPCMALSPKNHSHCRFHR